MLFSKEELKKLRADLPRGAARLIAAKHGLKTESVRNILSGSNNNENVLLDAFNMAKEHQEKIAAAKAFVA